MDPWDPPYPHSVEYVNFGGEKWKKRGMWNLVEWTIFAWNAPPVSEPAGVIIGVPDLPQNFHDGVIILILLSISYAVTDVHKFDHQEVSVTLEVLEIRNIYYGETSR